ncbi:MAG: hypothetical protein R8G33_12250 [Gammaproteobacteria bacterium]|nr:hypothetical protein [Gammaproteobacteria bacterium]
MLLITSVFGCSSESELAPFTSDGCSLFPDSSLINNDDWCECCVEHDKAYWKGGTEQQRERVDTALMRCVFIKTNDHVLANVMFEGVRFGGSPYFYNWYRWGYGWPYDRKYQSLSKDEEKLADGLLAEYKASGNKVCSN